MPSVCASGTRGGRRVPPMRERVVVGAVGLVGLALAVPSLGSPTWRIVASDPGRGEVLWAQSTWSWGKAVIFGPVSDQVVTNVPGLVALVLVLVAALAGLVLWVLVPGVTGSVAGLVGVSVAASSLVTATLTRIGMSGRVDAYRPTGLDVRSYLQTAAVCETLAAGVLVAVLAVMVWLTARARPAGAARVVADLDDAADEGGAARPGGARGVPAEEPAKRVGVASLEETGRARHLRGEEVGFSDSPPSDGPPAKP